MAATTLKAIIDRFQAVLEGADLQLKKTTEEFSFDRQPNTRIDNVYRIEDAGLVSTESATNNMEVRIDELAAWFARKATPDSQAVRDTLETDIVAFERKIVTDGRSNSYRATLNGREIERVDDVILARVSVLVDYDFSLT